MSCFFGHKWLRWGDPEKVTLESCKDTLVQFRQCSKCNIGETKPLAVTVRVYKEVI